MKKINEFSNPNIGEIKNALVRETFNKLADYVTVLGLMSGLTVAEAKELTLEDIAIDMSKSYTNYPKRYKYSEQLEKVVARYSKDEEYKM